VQKQFDAFFPGIWFMLFVSRANLLVSRGKPSLKGPRMCPSYIEPSGFFIAHSYMGKPCRTGYQSHYTLVNKDISQDGYPVLGKVDVKETADELVIFEYSQALPLFVIYIN